MAYRINYHQVVRQADKLEDEGNDIQKAIRQLDALIDEIYSIWNSPASKVFLAQCQELRQQMQAAQQNVNYTADSIRHVARRMKEADDRAEAEAKQLQC